MSVEIRDRDGRVIRRSRNLRGILTHLRGRVVKVVDVSRVVPSRFPHADAKLSILWENGDSVETDFADFDVCRGWVAGRSTRAGWLRGAPLLVNGEPAGACEPDNPALA